MKITEAQKSRIYNDLERIRIQLDGHFFKELKKFFSDEALIFATYLKAGSNEAAFLDRVEKRRKTLEDYLVALYIMTFKVMGVPALIEAKRYAVISATRITANTKRMINRAFLENKNSLKYIYAVNSRVMRIVRTEVNCSVNTARHFAALSHNLQNKMWLSPRDKITRDSHTTLEGAVVPINSTFSNGLLYPGDIYGSLSDVINCRCFCYYF